MMIYECLMLMLMLCKSSYARLTPEVLQPVPCSQAGGLASLISEGVAAEPPLSVDTSGVAVDPPAPIG